jgi:hypothetical protein
MNQILRRLAQRSQDNLKKYQLDSPRSVSTSISLVEYADMWKLSQRNVENIYFYVKRENKEQDNNRTLQLQKNYGYKWVYEHENRSKWLTKRLVIGALLKVQ